MAFLCGTRSRWCGGHFLRTLGNKRVKKPLRFGNSVLSLGSPFSGDAVFSKPAIDVRVLWERCDKSARAELLHPVL